MCYFSARQCKSTHLHGFAERRYGMVNESQTRERSHCESQSQEQPGVLRHEPSIPKQETSTTINLQNLSGGTKEDKLSNLVSFMEQREGCVSGLSISHPRHSVLFLSRSLQTQKRSLRAAGQKKKIELVCVWRHSFSNDFHDARLFSYK